MRKTFSFDPTLHPVYMKSKASKAAGAYNLLLFIDRLATSYTLQRQDQYDQLLPYS